MHVSLRFSLPPRSLCIFLIGYALDASGLGRYQLRAHIYQARDIIGEDSTGMSDAFIYVIFGNRSAKTTIVKQSICPMWDQARATCFALEL